MPNKVPFEFIQLYKNIFLFLFDSGYDVAMAFVRVAEFYESEFAQARGKYFTLEEYMKWYTDKYGKGTFTYPDDWAGWNVPGDHFMFWLKTFRGKFRPIELEVFAPSIMNLGEEKIKKSYFIGTYRCDDVEDVIKHELAHGLYRISRAYREHVNKLLNKLKKNEREKILTFVKDLGYHKKLWKDEMQAYIVTGEIHEEYNFEKVSLQKEFEELFEKFKKRGLNGDKPWERRKKSR